MDQSRQELSYSLADIACAKLAVYQVLPSEYTMPQSKTKEQISRLEVIQLLYDVFGQPVSTKCPYKDVPLKYQAAVTWAADADITNGVGKEKFGIGNIRREDFLSMLRKCSPEHKTIVDQMKKDVPFGLSSKMTLGDTALYLCSYFDKTNYPEQLTDKLDKIPFPQKMILSPKTKEEATILLQSAIRFLPQEIVFDRAGGINEKDFLDLFFDYRRYEYELCSDTFKEELWFLPCTSPGNFNVMYDTDSSNKQNLNAFKKQYNKIYESYSSGKIDGERFTYEVDVARAKILGNHQKIKIRITYNDAWQFYCNHNYIFTNLENQSLLEQADKFYEETMKPYESASDYEKIMQAKKAICAIASYNHAEEGYTKSGSSLSKESAHNIEGFFTDGKIVCDGYAKIFQYLMHRAGIPCVSVYGSISGPNQGIDHTWNKVKLDGAWYNMDVCWADTGHGTRFDLKSDDYMLKNRHWALEYLHGTLVANHDYTIRNLP